MLRRLRCSYKKQYGTAWTGNVMSSWIKFRR